MNKKQKATMELMDYILTWDEANKNLLDPHLAEKLAEHLVTIGYSRKVSRKERLITCFGKTQRLMDWCREYGINVVTLHSRLKKGWGVEEALLTPADSVKGHGPNGRAVCQIDDEGNIVETFDRIIDAAAKMGCTPASIMECCREHGRLKTVCGYSWKYVEEKKEK